MAPSHKIVPGYGCWIISMNVDVERKFYKAGTRKERRQKRGKKSGYWWYLGPLRSFGR